MLPYPYPALPLLKPGKHTRLLRLSPGEFADGLHVELEQVLLDGSANYEALSYAWGSSANPVSIHVGPSREHTISVTQNLAAALQHLRDANESRVLWVDAVCIDQSNLTERSYQVTLMSDIYRAACRVVVWLGPEDDDSFHAFNAMHDIGSSIDADWINRSYKPKVVVNNPSSGVLEEPHRFRDKETHAVNRLLHRQWFERLWIRQEIGLATQAAVRCGRLFMPWHVFKNAIFFIYLECGILMAALGDQYASFVSRIVLVYRICKYSVYNLQNLRGDIAHVVCADPRDRIYGMLSLLHPSQYNMGIVPDYTRDVALVYQDATIRVINHTKNLSTLLQCELQDTPPHMPTWVPDWSTELKAEQVYGRSSNTSANFEAIATSKGEGVLSVAGVAIAIIEDVQPTHIGASEDDFETKLRALWERITSNSATSDDTRTTQLSAMCDALCCGAFRHTYIPSRTQYPDFKSVMQTFRSISATDPISSGIVDSMVHWASYRRLVNHLCRNRSFFVTTEGSVGIAPLSARPGDIVCVILGCYGTILLRQTGADAYQIIGQSYTPGVNTGEALLGPLPGHLRLVSYHNEDAKGFEFAYWNQQTERVQFKDPRLDELLLNPGFQVHDHGHNDFPTIETSVEALRNTGIAAQYFDLI